MWDVGGDDCVVDALAFVLVVIVVGMLFFLLFFLPKTNANISLFFLIRVDILKNKYNGFGNCAMRTT